VTSREPPGDPKELILGALDQPLGGDLLQVVIYGSSVTGDILPGLSDLDVVIRTARPLDLKAAGLVAEPVPLPHAAKAKPAQAPGATWPSWRPTAWRRALHSGVSFTGTRWGPCVLPLTWPRPSR